MSLTSIIAGIRHASIGFVELDVSIEELHSSRARVTRHPVEDGADIGDHVIQEPDGLRMTGMISNQPLDRSIFDVRSVLQADTPEGIAETAYDLLLYLVQEKEPITVVTTLKTYDDMILESIDVPRNARLGNVVRFTATLTALRKVNSETVEAPEPEVERAKPAKNRGKQPAKPATEAQSKSFASNLAGVGG